MAIRHTSVLKNVAPGEDLTINLTINALTGEFFDGWDRDVDDARIDWVIVGGESGVHMGKPEHADRWMKPEWARDLRDQCEEAECAFFMKQHSAIRSGVDPFVVEADGSHTEWHQFPKAIAEVTS